MSVTTNVANPTPRNEQRKATGQQGQLNGRKTPISWAEKVKVTNANSRFSLEPLARPPPGEQLVIPEEAMEDSEQWSRCLVGFFPDDLLVFCHGNKDTVGVIRQALEEFSDHSGLKINLAKSAMYLTGITRVEKEDIERGGGIKLSSSAESEEDQHLWKHHASGVFTVLLLWASTAFEGNGTANNHIAKTILAVTVYYLWIERNERTFKRVHRSPQNHLRHSSESDSSSSILTSATQSQTPQSSLLSPPNLLLSGESCSACPYLIQGNA
ncbi:hypothetical protein OIU84_004816 [Salix udensis]|uniref:Reverse transcriptase domain-containing protein n=1 Tax=Salix udensis TaxID=889485 RepID=A0AAD6K3Z5_9ROSI|nr:hypothetical protein OIU84_004816 [Salix udensis]